MRGWRSSSGQHRRVRAAGGKGRTRPTASPSLQMNGGRRGSRRPVGDEVEVDVRRRRVKQRRGTGRSGDGEAGRRGGAGDARRRQASGRRAQSGGGGVRASRAARSRTGRGEVVAAGGSSTAAGSPDGAGLERGCSRAKGGGDVVCVSCACGRGAAPGGRRGSGDRGRLVGVRVTG